jgi:hypothetical protein
LALPSITTQTTSVQNLSHKCASTGRLASSLSHAGAALSQDGTLHLPRPQPPPNFAPMTSANLPYLGPAARTNVAEVAPLSGTLAVDAALGATRRAGGCWRSGRRAGRRAAAWSCSAQAARRPRCSAGLAAPGSAHSSGAQGTMLQAACESVRCGTGGSMV